MRWLARLQFILEFAHVGGVALLLDRGSWGLNKLG